MMGWRARLGFLTPPGNPTLEPEMMELAPPGVSLHFTRMTAGGAPGSHDGQEERNRRQIESIPGCVELLAMVQPKVIALAHTATSYTLGREGEAELTARMQAQSGVPFITAFGSTLAALEHLGVRRIAYATPYSAAMTLMGKRHLEACGVEVVGLGQLEGVRNIYEETAERAYAIGRQVDCDAAEAIFLSGVGMPTLGALQALEDDAGKPVISAASATLWNALRIAGVRHGRPGYGRLLA